MVDSRVEDFQQGNRKQARSPKVPGLQRRMTRSYVWVTIVLVLVLEALNIAIVTGTLNFSAAQEADAIVNQRAQIYALEAAALAHNALLDPQTTFVLGQSATLAPPDTKALNAPVTIPNNLEVALLITPDKRILASSAPEHYPINALAAALLPDKAALIAKALTGGSASATDLSATGGILWTVRPVWNREQKPIGAVYLQEAATAMPLSLVVSYPLEGGVTVLFLLLLLAPLLGGWFGTMTTRGLVKRVYTLVAATTQIANGNYGQRLSVGPKDEIGTLEYQFNRMAQQLAEGTAQRQALAEENARLAERARISRELHDAISQDLFSLRMLTDGLQLALPADSQLHYQIATLEQTTSNMTREMRALLLEMRPTRLTEQGLAAALKDLAATYRARLDMTIITDIADVPLEIKVEHTLLRVAQEALSNAIRHANATIITLSLYAQDGAITLTISDNGQGLAPDDNGIPYGLGLLLMQERVQELHGHFSLETASGQGTCIRVSLI